jgi:hypothetical protein
MNKLSMAAKITNIRSGYALLNYGYCTQKIVSSAHRGLLLSPYIQAKVRFCCDSQVVCLEWVI